jgi:hypothetical protein
VNIALSRSREFLTSGRASFWGFAADATVSCWGYTSDGESTPPAGAFTQISAGNYHTCGLRADGFAVCWGDLVTSEP